MIFAGIAGVFQIVVLPGLLIYRLMRFQTGFLRSCLSIFGLSVAANYIIVFLLTILKIYTQPVLAALIILEVLAILIVYRRSIFISFEDMKDWLIEKYDQFHSLMKPNPEYRNFSQFLVLIIRILFGIAALAALVWIIKVTISNMGTVFNSWDAVLSWNRWAVDWGQNHLPLSTRHYPQLAPINWSLTYTLMGNTSIQLFAKSVIPLFTAGILLVFLDLGLKKRSAGYFLGLALCAFILKTNLGEYIGEGYSDIPAAFLGLMAFYSLLRIDPQKDDLQKAYIQGAIFAGAAAVTKQTGVLVLFLYGVFAFLVYFYPKKELSLREKMQKWLLPLIIVGLVVVPWYVYKQIAIIQGWEISEVGVIGEITNQAHDQANIFLRSYQALISLGNVLIFFGLAILSTILVDRRFKYLVLGVIVPFTLIWSVYASYDSRNLAMMYPLVAMVCGIAIDRILDMLAPRLIRLKLNKIPAVSLLILICLAGGLYLSRVSNRDLISRQETLQRQNLQSTFERKNLWTDY